MKTFFKKILDIWCNWWFLIIIILVVIFGLIYEKSIVDNYYDKPIPYNSLTESEKKDSKLETLEEENTRLQEDLSHTQAQLEELQNEYEDAKSLIKILQEQLEKHGIEPEEL